MLWNQPPAAGRGDEIWRPEPLFAGQLMFLLAGGPSLKQATADRIRGHGAIMVINSSHLLVPDADVLFFTDSGWAERHVEVIRTWRGIAITLSTAAKAMFPDILKRFKVEWSDDFRDPSEGTIKAGRSSGHTAISVAHALGCRDVVLLGYDMRLVDGREHHHTDYIGITDPATGAAIPRTDMGIYEREFLPKWQGWNAAAVAAGMRVRNATPGSALREFPMVDLDDVLAEGMFPVKEYGGL